MDFLWGHLPYHATPPPPPSPMLCTGHRSNKLSVTEYVANSKQVVLQKILNLINTEYAKHMMVTAYLDPWIARISLVIRTTLQ